MIPAGYASNLHNVGNTDHALIVVFIHQGQMLKLVSAFAWLKGTQTGESIGLAPTINGFWESNVKLTVSQLNDIQFAGEYSNGGDTGWITPSNVYVGWFKDSFSYYIFWVFV